MEFIKYTHLERFGTDEVDGISIGKCHIFPKLDGTNASFWFDGAIQCGSRNRLLSVNEDNAGFMNWLITQENHKKLAMAHPGYVFYGEWLVPHSLKTYQDDAWRDLYIFDVYDRLNDVYLPYEVYKPLLDAYHVTYIPCVGVVTNPTYEILCKYRDENFYKVKDNSGAGEGIVIKQYNWKNNYGRTSFAKLITNHFKDAHIKEMGGSVIKVKLLEEEIAEEFITKHIVDKAVAKIRTEQGQFSAKNIPQLFGMVFHELIIEEMWEIIKKHKYPKIDFKTLNTCTIVKIKQLLPELFGQTK